MLIHIIHAFMNYSEDNGLRPDPDKKHEALSENFKKDWGHGSSVKVPA
jgi:hypothetical protein